MPRPPDTDRTGPLSEALSHLYSAAAHADELADGDLFSPWTALTDQIRLVAAGINATVMPFNTRITTGSVHQDIAEALAALDADRSGNPDHLMWLSHLHELRRITAGLPAGP